MSQQTPVRASLQQQHVVAGAATVSPPAAASMAAAYVAAPGEGVGIYRGTDGYLYCDGLRIDDIRAQSESSPVYIYSEERIRRNYAAYEEALTGLDSIIGYAVKANNNLKIVQLLR